MSDDDVIRVLDEDDLDELDGDTEHAEPVAEDQPDPERSHTADSPMDRLRARYTQRLEKKRLIVGVPGWEGILAVEFGLLGPREIQQLRSITRTSRDKASADKKVRHATADLLAAATVGLCEGMVNGTAKPLELEDGERAQWLDVFQFVPAELRPPNPTTRGGLIAAFTEDDPPKVNDVALQEFAARVSVWMADTSSEVDGAMDIVENQDGSIASLDVDPES